MKKGQIALYFILGVLITHGLGTEAFCQTNSGTIVAWGLNDQGQCSVPAPNSGFIAISAGWNHSLGLKSDGTIVAWGRNDYGQCNVPAPNSGFIAIAQANGFYSLGLKSDGTIVAWGQNTSGQCNVPAPNSGFTAITAGGWHSLGLKSDGTIVAWGSNGYGQCSVPAPNSGFIAIAAGWIHSLGLKSDGTIVAWGRNDYGQCNVPAPNSGFIAIAAGEDHSLGLKSDGAIVVWGSNTSGQCNVPPPNSGFTAITAGAWHSLGLKSDGTIVAWGLNGYGQCSVPAPNSGFTAITAGGWHSLGLKSSFKVLFDDFDYATNESLYNGIWYALPQARDKITVSEGGANYGELNLFLPSGYEGKDAGDPNAPALWTINHYNGGTYFARVWFTDQPLHNYDPICEAFWLQNSSKLEKTEKYSEHDFEYLPYDSWDLQNPNTPAMWTTSWLKHIGCLDDRQNFQKKVALGDKWVELMMKIKPNQSVEFYVFDDTGTLVNGYPWHGDTQYAPRTETAMQIFFNMWLENGTTSKASYKMKVDYMLFIQNETTYQRSDLIALVNYYRMNNIKSKNTTIPLPAETIGTSDFLGTWDGQGVYYRNSDTNGWSQPLASPATVITSGYLDCDVVHDILGVWPNQSGVWVQYSRTGSWAKLSSTAKHIAAGDMNGDGRDDLLATWDGQGVFYRDSVSSAWVKMASPATLITAGDLDGDGKNDLIGIWPAQEGVWVKYSKTGAWSKLSSTAKDIAAGDMNGDGRDDLLATWDGQGVYYRNSMNGAWVKMSTPADQVTCGDLDADGQADLIGIWPTQGGVWVKYSATGSWAKLSSSARDIAAGKMRAGTGGSMASQDLFGPMGGYAQGPESLIQYQDTSSEGPGGLHFVYQTEELLIPQEHESGMMRITGPGEPGFRCVEEKNLFPLETKKRR